MATHIVVSLYLSGKKKKVFKSGAKVSASDFEENFDKLVSGGYIKAIESSEKEVETETEVETAIEPLFVIDRKGESHNVFSEKDINKTEIISLLEKIEGVEFDEADKKADLWDLLIAQ